MSSESYSLAEVAELLGISKRTLQRQIRDGAFPGRFLAPSPHGMEMRIPASDVAQVGNGSTSGTTSSISTEWPERQLATISAVPTTGSALPVPVSEIDDLKDELRQVLQEERALLLSEVRAMLEEQVPASNTDMTELKGAVDSIAREVRELRRSMHEQRQGTDHRWSEVIAGPNDFDVDNLLAEIGELEAILGVTDK